MKINLIMSFIQNLTKKNDEFLVMLNENSIKDFNSLQSEEVILEQALQICEIAFRLPANLYLPHLQAPALIPFNYIINVNSSRFYVTALKTKYYHMYQKAHFGVYNNMVSSWDSQI